MVGSIALPWPWRRPSPPAMRLPSSTLSPAPISPSSLCISLPFPRRAAAVTATLREVCAGCVPDHVLQRAEEVGYVVPTEVQEQSLPLLLSGQDCILHAQVVLSSISFGFLPICFRYQDSLHVVCLLSPLEHDARYARPIISNRTAYITTN
ncbi:unnamed protein product [Urochloa humidicola]